MSTISERLTPTPWRVGEKDYALRSIWSANGVRVCFVGASDWDLENAERIVQSVNAAAAPEEPDVPEIGFGNMAPQGEPVAGETERLRDERVLRRLLALRSGIPHLYLDDGEAQGEEQGIRIDFMREPVADLEVKLLAMNAARMECREPPNCDDFNKRLIIAIGEKK